MASPIYGVLVIAAIVLAAGASERMGSPKALLRYRGRSFLEAILDAAYAAGVGACFVVLGEDADKVLSECDLGKAQVLKNPAPAGGPISSIRIGIEALLNRPVEATLIWPVDVPHVSVGTVQALLARFRQGGAAVVVPRHGERRGHPVLFGRAVFDALLAAPDTQGARSVVRSDPSRVAEVDVDDRAVLNDIDTPEDYAELLRRQDAR